MRRIFIAAGLIAGAASGLSAEPVTKKFDYKPVDGIQNVNLVIGGVKINQVVFNIAKEGGPRRPSNEAVVRIDNEGEAPVSVGVALVVMDEAGNILAAGSAGTRSAWLAPGTRTAASLKLPYVSRSFAKAKSFTITVESETRSGAAPPE